MVVGVGGCGVGLAVCGGVYIGSQLWVRCFEMCDSTQAVVELTYERGGLCPVCGGETVPEAMLCHGGLGEETSGWACVVCSWSMLGSVVEAVAAIQEGREGVVVLREECPTQRGFGGGQVPVPEFCSASCVVCGESGAAHEHALHEASVTVCRSCSRVGAGVRES